MCLCESGFAFDSTNTTCQAIDLCLTGDHGGSFEETKKLKTLPQDATRMPPAHRPAPDITRADAKPASRATVTHACRIVRWFARTGESVSSPGNAPAPQATRWTWLPPLHLNCHLCVSMCQGAHCQEDINECLLGPAVHQCGDDSRCVNR